VKAKVIGCPVEIASWVRKIKPEKINHLIIKLKQKA
jgi:hypothetical protein